MGIVALVLLAAFGVVCLAIPSWRHVRSTGRSPFLTGGAHGPLAIAAFAVPFGIAAALDLTGTARIVSGAGPTTIGLVLGVAGVVGTAWAQRAMGESWRVGIDLDERTALVTTGPYRSVRNPIYTAMFAFALGLALLVPNVASLLGMVGVVAVIDVVVRRVEEPYLESVHGPDFRAWAGRTGRFLPGLGRLRPPHAA
jgi:protein-S-isoprenylcysteine O-methyltransferase Ste14